MPFIQFPYPLQFDSTDRRALSPEALAMQMGVSTGFVRLCLDTGCPNAGRISAADLLHWLVDHYEEVRAAAGLRVLASVDGLAPATVAQLRAANALTTLLEYTRTRATDWRKKRQLRVALEQVDRLADHSA